MDAIPITLGGKTRYVRFTGQSAQRAVQELQLRMPVSWVPQKLQPIGAATLINAPTHDPDAIVIFLRHGLYEEKGVTDDKLWRWIDAHRKAGGTDSTLANAILDALDLAGVVKLKDDKDEADDEADASAEAAPPRPTGATVHPLAPPATVNE